MTRILYTAWNTATLNYDLYASNGPGQTTDIAAHVWETGLVEANGKVLFQNIGTYGSGLSVTNGYAAGTAPIFSSHVFPGITVFGSKALFAAEDSSGNTGMWVTDLANNTTREIEAGQQGSYNLNPLFGAYIAGNYAYFGGTDSSGQRGLFRTDGTTTFEIEPGNAHPPGAGTNGKLVVFSEWDAAAGAYDLVSESGTLLLSKSQGVFWGGKLTPVGNELLFLATNAAGHNSMWATDGTTTEEVIDAGDRDPTVLSVFGNRAVIWESKVSSTDSSDFWIWNGFSLIDANTSITGPYSYPGDDFAMVGDYLFFDDYIAGRDNMTSTLGVMNVVTGKVTTNANFAGSLYSAAGVPGPFPFIALGDKEVLFGGGENAGGGLWAADGLSDPVEIIASTSPLPVEPTFFFALNDRQVLFTNEDGSLWVTDGTYGGSFRIENAQQGAYTLQPDNFRAIGNGLVAFDALGPAGYNDTWVTNGTAAGTYELAVGVDVEDIVTLPDQPPPADFKGSGNSDVLFRAGTTGDTGFYRIANSANAGWVDIGASSTAYSVAGTGGDFNGDGVSDVLFRNNANGDTGFYAIVNGANTGWHDVGASSTAYSVMGTGDFNNDGTSDILYRNNSTGDTGFYAIVGGVNTGWYDVGASSTAYAIVGVGDFNNDGTSDILYRNGSNGDTGFYASLVASTPAGTMSAHPRPPTASSALAISTATARRTFSIAITQPATPASMRSRRASTPAGTMSAHPRPLIASSVLATSTATARPTFSIGTTRPATRASMPSSPAPTPAGTTSARRRRRIMS